MNHILINALNIIADYDYLSGKEGICPYGCDTPHIARQALKDYADAGGEDMTIEPIHKCVICKKDVPDYKPEYCCNGDACGCFGMPIEPPVCSRECWDTVISNIGQPKPEEYPF